MIKSIRMHKDLFFDTIVLIFTQNDHGWAVSCSDNLYIDTGDVRKLLNLPLENGAVFRVKYQDSSADVFTIEYLLDFESEKKKYERAIDISNVSKLQIGVSPACQVVLNSPYVKEDRIDFEVTPHQLRHTYITNLIFASVDPKTVQYLAGHENSKITMDIYAKAKYNRPKDVAPMLEHVFNQWNEATTK